MDQNGLSFNPNLLFILQGFTIYGETRIQKYGFQIYQNYKNELKDFNFYSDWIPYYYGPYSQSLRQDLTNAINQGYIECIRKDAAALKSYTLTIKGNKKYRELIEKYPIMFKELHELVLNLQKKRLVVILKDLYAAYPRFTTKSKIADVINKNEF